MPTGPKSVLRAQMAGQANGETQSLKSLGQFGAIGVEMAVFVVLGVKGGQWLDAHFQVSFWTLVGLAFGLFAGFRSLFQLTRRLRKQAALSEAARSEALSEALSEAALSEAALSEAALSEAALSEAALSNDSSSSNEAPSP